MKTGRLIAAGWLGFTSLVTAGTEFATLFPADTIVYAQVGEPDKLARLGEHPVIRCLEPGRLGEFVGDAIGGLFDDEALKSVEEETGVKLDELRGKFSGGVAAGMFDAKLSLEDSSIQFALAVEYSGDEEVMEKLIAAGIRQDRESMEEEHELMKKIHEEMKEEAKEEGEEEPEAPEMEITWLQDLTRDGEKEKNHDGATLHIYKMDAEAAGERKAEWDEIAWCVRDGLLLLASGEEELRDMLDRAAAKRAEGTLAGTAAHAAALKEAGGAEIFLCAHFSDVIPELMKMLEAESPSEKPSAAPSPAAIFKGLGVDRLHMALLGIKVEEDALVLSAGVTYGEQPGIVKVFQLNRREPPAIFPADARDVSWMPLDLKGVVRETGVIFDAIIPGWERVLALALARTGAALPADLKKEVLPHLGTGYFQVTKSYATGTAESVEESDDDVLADVKFINISNPKLEGAVFGFGISDHKALLTAYGAFMENLDKRGSKTEKREYLQFTVHDIRSESSPELPVSCVLTDDWLLVSVGRRELLESMLARIARPEGEHLFSRADITAGFKALPDDPGGHSYSDLREAVNIFAYAFAALLADETDEEFEDSDTLLKGFKFPIHAFERTLFTGSAARSIMRIVPRSGD